MEKFYLSLYYIFFAFPALVIMLFFILTHEHIENNTESEYTPISFKPIYFLIFGLNVAFPFLIFPSLMLTILKKYKEYTSSFYKNYILAFSSLLITMVLITVFIQMFPTLIFAQYLNYFFFVNNNYLLNFIGLSFIIILFLILKYKNLTLVLFQKSIFFTMFFCSLISLFKNGLYAFYINYHNNLSIVFPTFNILIFSIYIPITFILMNKFIEKEKNMEIDEIQFEFDSIRNFLIFLFFLQIPIIFAVIFLPGTI